MRSLILGVGLASLLAPTISAAQQIRGVVVDDSTGAPVPDVTIELLAADSTTLRTKAVAAVTGWFELSPGSGGTFLLRASHPAYVTVGSLAVAVGDHEIVTVVLRISGGPIPLEPLLVKARARDPTSGFRERAKRGAFGRFIQRADIDRNPAARLSDLLRSAPEVRIERVRDGAFLSDGVFMRSFGDLCTPSIYLDGVPVPSGAFGFDINDLITTEAIAGIEIYRSSLTAPMELRLPALGGDVTGSCGVIAFWSRPVPGKPINRKRLVIAGLLVGAMLLLAR